MAKRALSNRIGRHIRMFWIGHNNHSHIGLGGS